MKQREIEEINKDPEILLLLGFFSAAKCFHTNMTLVYYFNIEISIHETVKNAEDLINLYKYIFFKDYNTFVPNKTVIKMKLLHEIQKMCGQELARITICAAEAEKDFLLEISNT